MSLTIAMAAASTLMTANAQHARACQGGPTPQVETCLEHKLADAHQEWQRYAAAAARRATPSAKRGFLAGEKAFTAYRHTECDAVWQNAGGTSRPAFAFRCMIRLTQLHTHSVWTEWLRPIDDTPPILPEPAVVATP